MVVCIFFYRMLKTSPRTEEVTPKTLFQLQVLAPPHQSTCKLQGRGRYRKRWDGKSEDSSPLHPSTRSSLLTQPLGYLLPPAWKPHGTVTGPTARQGCDSRWACTGPLGLSLFICNVGSLTQLLESPLMKSKMYFITLLLEIYYELNSHFYNHLGT